MKVGAKDILAAGAVDIGIPLSPAELGKFYAFAAELIKWSRKVNITAIRDDEEIAVKHFIDSLAVLKVAGVGGHLLDIGSGGGFPAIPLKIARGRIQVVSVDAVEKKVLFQRHVARLLALHGFEAVHARAEELPARYGGSFDWIVSRAFTDIPTFVRIALPLLKEDGRIIAMKGRGGREEAEAAGSALHQMGAEVNEIMEFPLPFSGDARSLVIIKRS